MGLSDKVEIFFIELLFLLTLCATTLLLLATVRVSCFIFLLFLLLIFVDDESFSDLAYELVRIH
jgi:hypothetical protein